MWYGTTTTMAAILMALVAGAPLIAGAADTKAETTTQEGKTMVTDSWVTTTKNGVVHLRGKVDSDEAKAAAAELGTGIEGATSVKNDLQVVSPTARKAVDANDKDIAKAVESRMSRDANLKKVDVRSDGGVVTLTGEVPSITASAKASEQARMVSWVKSVKNELTLRQASK